MYRIGLPSNAATLLALFGGSQPIEPRTNRAIVLKSIYVFGAWHVFLRIEILWLGDPRLQRKQRVGATDMLDGICPSETGILSDGRTDTRIDVGKTISRH